MLIRSTPHRHRCILNAGDNAGWRLKEGSFFYNHIQNTVSETPFDEIPIPSDFVPRDPILEYDHDEGISIIGGFIYRGSAIPELVGKYVFGDFSRAFFEPDGRLLYGDFGTGEIREFIIGLDNRSLGLYLKGFGEDENGELFVLAGTNLGPFEDENGETFGQILKIVAVPLLGDVNLDGVINLLDIEPFVELITAGKSQVEADINLDGDVNLLDIQPFVFILTG